MKMEFWQNAVNIQNWEYLLIGQIIFYSYNNFENNPKSDRYNQIK